MTIEITARKNDVLVRYKDGNGNSATASVTGLTASDVKDRAQGIVDTHNLEDRAQ